MAYGRRSKKYSQSAGFAKRHIREALEFSNFIGGADVKVKEFFFSLSPESRDVVFRAYGQIYGANAEEYARNTYSKWRSGKVAMSGLVTKRLFEMLPLVMTPEKKYDIAKYIWDQFAPSSSLKLAIGPTTPTNLVIDTLSRHLSSVLTEHMIPERISSGFKWLSENDVVFYEKMLNDFRAQISQQVLERAAQIIATIQNLARNNNAHAKAETSFTVHKHSIYIKVIPELEDKIEIYTPELEHKKSNFFILVVIGVIIYLIFNYLTSN